MTIFAYAVARAAAQLLDAAKPLTKDQTTLLEHVLLPAIERYEAEEMVPSKAQPAKRQRVG